MKYPLLEQTVSNLMKKYPLLKQTVSNITEKMKKLLNLNIIFTILVLLGISMGIDFIIWEFIDIFVDSQPVSDPTLSLESEILENREMPLEEIYNEQHNKYQLHKDQRIHFPIQTRDNGVLSKKSVLENLKKFRYPEIPKSLIDAYMRNYNLFVKPPRDRVVFPDQNSSKKTHEFKIRVGVDVKRFHQFLSDSSMNKEGKLELEVYKTKNLRTSITLDYTKSVKPDVHIHISYDF